MHADENNVILCSGVNLVWNMGGRESPGQTFLSRTFIRRPFGRWHRKRWQLSFQLLVYQDITVINPNTSLHEESSFSLVEHIGPIKEHW